MEWLESEGFITVELPKSKGTKKRPAKLSAELSDYLPS